MRKYEQQLRTLKENGMYYDNVKKAYKGRVEAKEFFGVPCSAINTFGYYKDENDYNSWIVFVTDEERGIEERRKVCFSENEAIEKLLDIAERNNFIYLCNSIIKSFSEKETMLVDYLNKEYGYSKEKSKKAIEYLLQNKYIAFEFVYFVEYGTFVPKKYAIELYGYTAERLSKETSLTILGAYNYMIYLESNPNEALENIKKGLPRK